MGPKHPSRTLEVGPHEPLFVEARHYAKTDAYRIDRRKRLIVERQIARMVRLGARFARFHGQMPAVMAGDADNAIGKKPPGFGVRGVFLADMDAVAAQFRGEIRPVVQDEGGAGRLHHRAQRIYRAADLVTAGIFQA